MSADSKARTLAQVFIENILRDAAEFGWQMRIAAESAPPGAVTLDRVRAEAVTLAFEAISEAVDITFHAARMTS